MAEQRPRGRDWLPSAEQAMGGALAGQEKLLQDVGKTMLREAPGATRFVLKRIPGLPGLAYDAAELATAMDKRRARAELAGGVFGGAIGALGGPVGVAVGAAAGERAGELIHDHKDDIKAWMDDRWRQVAQRAASEVRPYAPFDFHKRPDRPIGR